MADNSILIFKCLNPECGKMVKLRRPQKSGIYPITCPHCKTQKKLNLKGLDAFLPGDNNPKSDEKQNVSQIDNSNKLIVNLKDDFICDEVYKFMCPHCGKQELGINSHKPGHKEFSCPLCKGKIAAEVRAKTRVIDIDGDSIQLTKGKLTLLRKGWLNKDYPLGLGSHTIGRFDSELMSDISIKNDSSMSRRSIKIDVVQSPKGFIFKLTVLKATNPVLHNNVALTTGETICLNFGDTIILGKTRFHFDKDI
ncbi:MAG: hypothetical protein NC453_19685 [Muribaculum sp.]|nr:hypothetical protein [Muribaculum sp.]